MTKVNCTALVVLLVPLFVGIASAQQPDPGQPPPKPTPPTALGHIDPFGIIPNPLGGPLGDLAKGGRDLLEAANKFKLVVDIIEKLMPQVKELTGQLGKDVVKATENLAKAADNLDPLGSKEAIRAVLKQQDTIQALLKADADRAKADAAALRAENEALRRQLASVQAQAAADGKQLIGMKVVNVVISAGTVHHPDEQLHVDIDPKKQAGQKAIPVLKAGEGSVVSVFMFPVTPGGDTFAIYNPGVIDGKPDHVNISAVGANSGAREFRVMVLYALTPPAKK